MNKLAYPAGDDDPSYNGNESNIRKPSLSLQGHKIRKDRSEKRRGSPDRLIERNRQKTKGNITADNGGAEDKAKGGDLHELDPRSDCLHGDHLHPGNGDVAEQRTSRHVAHGEEDRILEAIVAQQVLVEQQNPNVGRIPGRNKAEREESAGILHGRERGWGLGQKQRNEDYKSMDLLGFAAN